MAKVFISYSHDSKEHCERVLALANQLRKDGIDCSLDQYETSPGEGWPKWMESQLETSDHVIIICTEAYCRRAKGKAASGEGRGVKWESTLTYQYIYEDDSRNTRFIPVLFKMEDEKFIPTPLKGATFYCFDTDESYKQLYRRLTGQPAVKKPVLGQIKKLSSEKPKIDFLSLPSEPIGENKISISKLPTTGEKFFGREEELKELEAAWADEHTHIVTLIAWGGVGKSALVNRWLNIMERKNYRGARKVYGWSFYSQGAEEGKQASADEFMQETLKWFGDKNPGEGSAVEKGRRLARLVQKEKTLLVLDGMEPLQYPPGEVHGFDGRLKDQGLKAFLKELSAGHPGLCLITSREPVTDLAHNKGFTLKEMELEHLSPGAGVQLLKSLGVKGTEKEVKKAVAEYKGHALALTLLGRYIKKVYDGDIRKRDKIPSLSGRDAHAQRVVQAYEFWMKESPELNVLRIMGLFDRPVEKGAVDALREDPAIPGVTGQLHELSEEDWQWALDNLRTASLLAKKDEQKPGVLDCHPLVREHFGRKLKRENPEGWKEAHKRLYYYYKDKPEKERPDTLAEMEPLFSAVAHGCRAGLHHEAEIEVYWKRIRRGKEAYTVHKLGAFGSDLAVLSHFFEKPWTHPAPGLTDDVKAVVLSWAAFRLRAQGRLHEAIQPMKAGLKMLIENENWDQAAGAAGNLSELMLTLGNVAEAVNVARESVTHADRSGIGFQKESKRTALADALHQAGNLNEAEQWFREAEAMQKKRQPQYAFLYSLQGYRYCDLLLGQGTYNDVMERAEKSIEGRHPSDSLLSISLENLALGRA